MELRPCCRSPFERGHSILAGYELFEAQAREPDIDVVDGHILARVDLHIAGKRAA